MAPTKNPTAEQVAGWKAWVASLPENVRIVADRFEPWSLYRMKSTGQRVTICSFQEDQHGAVTLTVNVTADYNLIVFERRVFGVHPDDLETCAWPSDDEPRGALISADEVPGAVDALRKMMGVQVKH